MNAHLNTKPTPSMRKFMLAGSIALAVALAGCSSNKKSVSSSSHQGASYATEEALQESVTYWGKRYNSDSKDVKTALNYGQSLRLLGRHEQALAVLEQLAAQHPTDRVVLAAYGKALATVGRFQQALQVLHTAQTPTSPDWRLDSAMGAIYDQVGDFQTARSHYDKALLQAPDEPSVLSNYGLSYLLEGDLASAEGYLRQAAKNPKADSRVRQNLALALGLQGKFQEAESIAQNELSPQQAAQNMAYLKEMLSERGNWDKIKKQG
nr:tetratricopeptide repeat protein [uncultured Cohaesibacter sp.]